MGTIQAWLLRGARDVHSSSSGSPAGDKDAVGGSTRLRALSPARKTTAALETRERTGNSAHGAEGRRRTVGLAESLTGPWRFIASLEPRQPSGGLASRVHPSALQARAAA